MLFAGRKGYPKVSIKTFDIHHVILLFYEPGSGKLITGGAFLRDRGEFAFGRNAL